MKSLSLKKMLQDSGISMPEHQIKAYTDIFAYLEHITENKYSEQQLFDLYTLLGDIAEGYCPEIAIIANNNDTIPTLVRIMEELPLTKGKLSMEQKFRIAFCVMAITGVHEQPKDVVFDWFESFESVETQFAFFRKQMPSWFKASEKKTDSKENYGLSIDNPIQTTSVRSSYIYLNRLKYKGKDIFYNRVGSIEGKNRHFVDKYNVYLKTGLFKKRSKYLCDIYIDAYASTEPQTAPHGFTLK